MSGTKLLVAVVVVVVAAAVAAAIVIIGPPREERTRRLDERRVEHLRHISQSVRLYYIRHMKVPASLEQLAQEPGISIVAADRMTGRAYEYRVAGETSFELCAIFETATAAARSADFWSHGVGRQCFTMTAKE